MNFLREWGKKRQERKKQRMRNEIVATLYKIKNEDNEGLLKRYLHEFPETLNLHIQSGMAGTWVSMTMEDGYLVDAYEMFTGDALVEAGNLIFDRLVEKYEL